MSLSSLYLDAFYACAQTGNFTQAAERLFITQSALSQRIKNLEVELEAALFIRDRAGVRLTEQGEILLKYCQVKESFEQEVKTSLSQNAPGLHGVIRIGAYSSVMRSVIMPALQKLLVQNPGVQLSVHTSELHDLPKMMKRGEIDFMILDHDIKRDDYVSKTLGHERFVLASPKNGSSKVYLDHDENDETTFKYLRISKGKKIRRSFLSDIYGLMDGVEAGIGSAVLPLHLIHGRKNIIVSDDRELENPVVLNYNRQDHYPKLFSAVIDTLISSSKKYLEI
jgi:DNA-binding transcriptional LysR family regulator